MSVFANTSNGLLSKVLGRLSSRSFWMAELSSSSRRRSLRRQLKTIRRKIEVAEHDIRKGRGRRRERLCEHGCVQVFLHRGRDAPAHAVSSVWSQGLSRASWVRSLPFPGRSSAFPSSCYLLAPDRRSWAISAFPVCAEILRV